MKYLIDFRPRGCRRGGRVARACNDLRWLLLGLPSVLAHEAGHLIACRLLAVRVEQFRVTRRRGRVVTDGTEPGWKLRLVAGAGIAASLALAAYAAVLAASGLPPRGQALTAYDGVTLGLWVVPWLLLAAEAATTAGRCAAPVPGRDGWLVLYGPPAAG